MHTQKYGYGSGVVLFVIVVIIVILIIWALVRNNDKKHHRRHSYSRSHDDCDERSDSYRHSSGSGSASRYSGSSASH